MSETLVEQVNSCTEDYGDGENARLFGLVHRVCDLELGRTMVDYAITDWHNPHGRYDPAFRLLKLTRTLRDDGSFRLISFILDLPDNMTVGYEVGMKDDPLAVYLSDVLEHSIEAHVPVHKLCVAEPGSHAAQLAAYRERERQRTIANRPPKAESLR